MKINSNGLIIRDLPPWTSKTKVMGDFLRYLYQETLKFIEERHSDAEDILKGIADRTTFVLSHPNGWEGAQQANMRKAAVKAGLIEDTTAGQARLHFVTEGEASLHYCISHDLEIPLSVRPLLSFYLP